MYNEVSCILQEKTDKILELLIEMTYVKNLKQIRTRFNDMTESKSIIMWTNQFHYDISNFKDNLGGFDPKDLKKLFKHIYENKDFIFVIFCSHSKTVLFVYF